MLPGALVRSEVDGGIDLQLASNVNCSIGAQANSLFTISTLHLRLSEEKNSFFFNATLNPYILVIR